MGGEYNDGGGQWYVTCVSKLACAESAGLPRALSCSCILKTNSDEGKTGGLEKARGTGGGNDNGGGDGS